VKVATPYYLHPSYLPRKHAQLSTHADIFVDLGGREAHNDTEGMFGSPEEPHESSSNGSSTRKLLVNRYKERTVLEAALLGQGTSTSLQLKQC